MLATMRKAIKKGLLQVVVWVTALSMVLFFSGGSIVDLVQRLFGMEDYVLSVNGQILTKKQFVQKEAELNQRIESIKQQYGPYADMVLQMSGITSGNLQSFIIKEAGANFLIDSIIKKYKIKLHHRFVTESLAKNLPKEMLDEHGKINVDALQQLFNGMSLADIEKSIEENLIKSFALNLVDAGVYIPRFMVNSQYAQSFAARKYGILTFSFDKYVAEAKKLAVSDTDINEQYANNKANYTVNEKRDVTVWTFPASSYGTTPSDKDVAAYYEKNKSAYVKDQPQLQLRKIVLDKNADDARQKASQIRGELAKNPAAFADLAKKYSKDAKTAAKGGLTDFVKKDDLEPALGQAAFALEQDNQISDIVTTEQGLEIVQRVGRKAATYKPLADVSNEIKSNLTKGKFAAAFNLEAKKVVKDAQKNATNINAFATQKKAKVENSTIEKGTSDLGKAAFRTKEGGFGYFVTDNVGYIVKVNGIKKSHIPDLKTIASKVKEDLYAAKATALMRDAMQKAKQALKTANIADVAKKYDAMLTITPSVSSQNTPEIEKLTKQGFPMKKILTLQKKSVAREFIEKDGYLVKVVDITVPEETTKNIQTAQKDLFVLHKDLLNKGFIASLAKTAKIFINKEEQPVTKKRK